MLATKVFIRPTDLYKVWSTEEALERATCLLPSKGTDIKSGLSENRGVDKSDVSVRAPFQKTLAMERSSTEQLYLDWNY